MNKNHPVEIPEFFLLILAVHGNMGDGELPDTMRYWAERECNRLGLSEKVAELQKAHLAELSKRVANIFGQDAVDWIEKATSDVAQAMKEKGYGSQGE